MEAARLGLHDYQLGGLRPGLGLEPWLGPPLSTLSHALPGFLSHPQAAYASYLTTPVSASIGLSSLSSHMASTAPAPVSPATSDGRLSPGMETPTSISLPFPLSEHRISSINALRLRAKEQMELFRENGFAR